MESYFNGKSICNTETMKFAATGEVIDAIGKGKLSGFDYFSIGNERRLLRLKNQGLRDCLSESSKG